MKIIFCMWNVVNNESCRILTLSCFQTTGGSYIVPQSAKQHHIVVFEHCRTGRRNRILRLSNSIHCSECLRAPSCESPHWWMFLLSLVVNLLWIGKCSFHTLLTLTGSHSSLPKLREHSGDGYSSRRDHDSGSSPTLGRLGGVSRTNQGFYWNKIITIRQTYLTIFTHATRANKGDSSDRQTTSICWFHDATRASQQHCERKEKRREFTIVVVCCINYYPVEGIICNVTFLIYLLPAWDAAV